MSNYVAGPSVLRLAGRVQAVIPGEPFAHDFSRSGPEGFDGPAREAALLAAGAMILLPGEITEHDRLVAALAAAQALARLSGEHHKDDVSVDSQALAEDAANRISHPFQKAFTEDDRPDTTEASPEPTANQDRPLAGDEPGATDETTNAARRSRRLTATTDTKE